MVGENTWGKGEASMDRPRRAGIFAQAETRSGNAAHQGPETCLVSTNAYNQPYYISLWLVYKITYSLQIDSFKTLILKEIGRRE